MSACGVSISTLNFLQDFHSRKLLLHSQLNPSPVSASPPLSHEAGDSYTESNFDANVVMVLSVLLCALICSLGLNSIVRCSLSCSNIASNDSGSDAPTRLANTGIKKKALKTFPTVNYSSDLNMQGLDTECVICLSEFTNGEKLRLLPKCNHGFHVRCIDKWLSSHSSCPKCRHCLIETCQKIVGCSQASSSGQPSLAPLEPEDLIRIYREN